MAKKVKFSYVESQPLALCGSHFVGMNDDDLADKRAITKSTNLSLTPGSIRSVPMQILVRSFPFCIRKVSSMTRTTRIDQRFSCKVLFPV